MTATSVLTLTVYLAIMVIVATAAVGIRSEWRELPPAPPPPVPVPVRAKGQSPSRGRHPFARGPGRLARAAWRMSRLAARRTGEVSVAAVRATPELPAHAARLGRHAAGRAEAGRVVFDHGAARRVYRLLHPALLRLVPLRERTGRLVLALLGPLRDLADRAARAGRNVGAGADADTWQLRVATLRRRAAQWRVPRPRRAGDLEPAAALDADASSDAAGEPAPSGTADDDLAPLETGDDALAPDDERVLGDWSRPAADQVTATAPASPPNGVPVTVPSPTPNGASPNGAPTNGAPTNGAAATGAPVNGATTNGAAVNRAPVNAAPANGAAATGATATVPAEPRPIPSAAALSAARLALAGIHRDNAARHQAAARLAARHHAAHPDPDEPGGPTDPDDEPARVIDLTAVEAEAEAR